MRLISELPAHEQAEHWKSMYDQLLDAYCEFVDIRNREVGEQVWIAIGTRVALDASDKALNDVIAQASRQATALEWVKSQLSEEQQRALEILLNGVPLQ